MNEFPSSSFMHRLYTGMKFYLFAPVIFIIIAMFFAAAGAFSKAIIYLMPLLIIVAASYLFATASNFNEETTDDVKSFVIKIKVGSLLWILAGALSLFMAVTESDSVGMLALIAILSVGFGVAGSGYGTLASNVGVRGAQLTARGCYTYVGSVILIAILLFSYKAITPPLGAGWYGPSAEEMQAYQTKMALISVFTVLAFLCTIGSLCAILFGSRFMVDSTELMEQAESSTNA